MARLLLSLLALGFAGAAQIVLPPSDGKTGASKVLVIINGAFVSNSEYLGLAAAIQDAASMPLWIALPSFALDCPDPVTIGPKIKDAIKAIQKAGFDGVIDPATDVVVGGHSLGGIFSQMAVKSGGYAGLMLFGSYLSSSNDNTVTNYPVPVLSLAGEMDGLTRITRIAQSWAEYASLIATTSDKDMKYTRAVVALAGVSHSLFCDTVNVTSFGTKDKCPEQTRDGAHAAMGATAAAFLAVTVGEEKAPRAAAEALIDEGLVYTESLVAGYLAAQALEPAGWCAQAQAAEVSRLSPATTLSVAVKEVKDFVSFDNANPSLKGTTVTCVDETQIPLNPTDVSTKDQAASEIDCKILSAAALAGDLGEAAPAGGDARTCEAANTDAIALAMDTVLDATRERYYKVEKPLVTGADVEYGSGVTWQAAAFEFDDSGDSVVVVSPRVTIAADAQSYAGQQMCKYLPPSRVIEYMMVDALPSFDECP